jgi:hypothetical protein
MQGPLITGQLVVGGARVRAVRAVRGRVRACVRGRVCSGGCHEWWLSRYRMAIPHFEDLFEVRALA